MYICMCIYIYIYIHRWPMVLCMVCTWASCLVQMCCMGDGVTILMKEYIYIYIYIYTYVCIYIYIYIYIYTQLYNEGAIQEGVQAPAHLAADLLPRGGHGVVRPLHVLPHDPGVVYYTVLCYTMLYYTIM